MAIVYCYDMSSSPAEMESSFKVFNSVIANEFVRGKPILIVGTKAEFVTYNVENYDIENLFELEKLANLFGSRIRVCQNSSLDHSDLSRGCLWLDEELKRDYKTLKNRLKLDKHQSSKKQRKRLSYWFTRKKVHNCESDSTKRPKTAPTISKTLFLYSWNKVFLQHLGNFIKNNLMTHLITSLTLVFPIFFHFVWFTYTAWGLLMVCLLYPSNLSCMFNRLV